MRHSEVLLITHGEQVGPVALTQSKCHQKTVEQRVWKFQTGRGLSSYPICVDSILDDLEKIPSYELGINSFLT